MLEAIPVVGVFVSLASLWLAYIAYSHGVGKARIENKIKGLVFDMTAENFKELETLARRGFADAQFFVGRHYLSGAYFPPKLFISKDHQKGYALLYKAAAKGHSEAIALLEERGVANAREALSASRYARFLRQVERMIQWSLVSCLGGHFVGLGINIVSSASTALWWQRDISPNYTVIVCAVLVGGVAALFRNSMEP